MYLREISPKQSCSPIASRGTGHSSINTSATSAFKPPTTLWFSQLEITLKYFMELINNYEQLYKKELMSKMLCIFFDK